MSPARVSAVRPTEERPHIRHAVTLELERHPGARVFVGSRTVQDDLAIARDIAVPCGDLFGRHVIEPGMPAVPLE